MGSASTPRGVRSARMAATTNSAKTSPHRCYLCSEFAKDCTAMIPPCTTLDHTVNQMRPTLRVVIIDKSQRPVIRRFRRAVRDLNRLKTPQTHRRSAPSCGVSSLRKPVPRSLRSRMRALCNCDLELPIEQPSCRIGCGSAATSLSAPRPRSIWRFL
jgi:hypothetical protein